MNRRRWRAAGAWTATACAVLALPMLSACSDDTADRAGQDNTGQAVTELRAAFDRLDQRTTQLRDAADIRRLQRAYGHYVDRAFWHDVADLFAEDAVIEFGNDGAYVGRERIREYYLRLGDGETGLRHGQINNHMQLQPVVHVADDGTTAQGRWRAFSMVGQFQENAVWAEGPYENEYVKEDGVWKISRLRWYPTFVVPYEDGWAASSVTEWRSPAAQDFPPDRPADERLPLFPDVYVAPFHYEHPTRRPVTHADDDAQLSLAAAVDSPAVSELADHFSQRRAQLARLEAWDAVENLQAIYGYYFDRQLWDDVATLFTDDATFEYGQYGVYRGRDSIRRGLELFGAAGPEHGRLNHHFQLQPVITVAEDGRSAKARWRGLNQLGVHGEYGEWSEGTYENEYVLEDGVWRISKVHFYISVIADYERGWGNDPKPMPGPSEAIPPDAPPTEVYESLPGVHIPPFHYRHPVSGDEVVWPRTEAGDGGDTGGETRIGPGDLAGVGNLAGLGELSDLGDRLMRIGQTLDRLQDERDIEVLQRSYGYYVDKSLYDDVANLFAIDGTVEIGGRGVFVGRDRVSEYMHWLTPPGPQYNQIFNHTQFQPVLTVNDDGTFAQGRWRALVIGGTGAGLALWGEVTYENEYVKRDGVWQISQLYAFFNMYSIYDQGWQHSRWPNTRPEEDLPPDRPPTVVYDMYPEIHRVPFHYANPVSGQRSGSD